MTFTDLFLDQHLDLILRASGSALKHWSMQKTKDDMRVALRSAVEAANAELRKERDELLQENRMLLEAYAVELEQRLAGQVPSPAAAGDVHQGWWLIWFEDADRKPEVFNDEAVARERYMQISTAWNAHLFGRIDCNHIEQTANAQPAAEAYPNCSTVLRRLGQPYPRTRNE